MLEMGVKRVIAALLVLIAPERRLAAILRAAAGEAERTEPEGTRTIHVKVKDGETCTGCGKPITDQRIAYSLHSDGSSAPWHMPCARARMGLITTEVSVTPPGN